MARLEPRCFLAPILGAILSLTVLLPAFAAVQSPAEEEESPLLPADQLVFLLEYVGSDYPAGVRNGTIINAFEYAEVLGFARLLQAQYARARPADSGAIPGLLSELTRRIAIRDSAARVSTTVTNLVPKLSQSLGASPWTKTPADLARGRRLYQSDCASCHGANGGGDGPAAAGLDPPATSFLDGRLRALSSRQIVGAIRFGIAGTAMAGFEGVRTPDELRDIGFFVASLAAKETLLASPDSAGPGSTNAEALDLSLARSLEDTFISIANRALPGVVGITALMPGALDKKAEVGVVTRNGGWQMSPSATARHPGFVAIGSGSGFFLEDDGTLLTARHFLVDPDSGHPADRIEVELSDDRRYLAWVVGLEPMIDLAVLRIDAPTAVPTLSMGQSHDARVGQWIIALGNPPGIETTFAVGSLSATPRRECYQQEPEETLFQTSLWVDSASFGGPIVDLDGRVLGMAQPRPGSRPTPGAASALRILPIDLALTIYEALQTAADEISPWLGFAVLEFSRDLRDRTANPPQTGLYIDAVYTPSVASEAGIESGDILVAIANRLVLSVADFQRELYLAGAGREVSLQLHHKGAMITRKITIAQRPAHLLPKTE